jgi:hypothetical protein
MNFILYLDRDCMLRPRANADGARPADMENEAILRFTFGSITDKTTIC